MAEINVAPFYGRVRREVGSVRRWLSSLVPVHVLRPFRAECQMAWLRLKTRGLYKKYREKKNLLVNIGCGDQGKTGWVNVDCRALPGVNCICDPRQQLPFSDSSVRAIYTEHFFEHIDYTEEVPVFLDECLRVLKPGGLLRIVVPDIAKYIAAYSEMGWEAMHKLRTIDDQLHDAANGSQWHTKMEVLNHLFRQGHEHKYAYDSETLKWVLEHCGFKNVTVSECGQSRDPECAIDNSSRSFESLYVEAEKL